MTLFEHSVQIRLLALRESLLKGDSARGSRERIAQELAEVDGALLRLARGQYGVCQRCGRALGSQRLLAEPVALLCPACERGTQPRGRRPRRGLRDGGAERQLPEGEALRGTRRERLPIAFDRHCMHEFVLSGAPMRKQLGLKTLDLAKRLLDFGFHPPTVYFPLLVDEALMIEPTETETKESLDAFADAVEEILEEAEDDPEVARQAPFTTPVRRLDEVKATRRPVLRQTLD